METVSTYCSQCGHHLGTHLNLWTQIGKSYISPVIRSADDLDISPDGAVRQGEKGTIVDSWGQLLLRTPSLQIRSLDGRETVKPIIQRLLDLKNPSTDEVYHEDDSQDEDHDSGVSENSTYGQATNEIPDLSRVLADVSSQKEEIQRLDTAGCQIVASFNQALQRIDVEVGKLKNEMDQMTGNTSNISTKTRELSDDIFAANKEIKEIKKALQPLGARIHLGQEPVSFSNAISEANTSLRVEFGDIWDKHQQKINLLDSKLNNVRRDLRDFQESFESTRTAAKAAVSGSDANTEEIAALKAEIRDIRQELALERSRKSPASNPVFAAREMDILTSSITTIGQRASQVETLRMEFDLLKGRVQRIEAQTAISQRDPTVNLQHQQSRYSQSVGPKRKGSPDSYVENGVNYVSSPSALNISDGHGNQPNSPTTHPTSLRSKPSAKTPRITSKSGIMKFTKSGAVDKRTLKRGARSATTARKAKS
ncbi:hypothetical protein NUW58_g9052 [Xylaria curta]|uniref:Uncharacterized protein n=1 Tax=Xylaria curta TaxID=42375 RepID=A0ACC1N3I3_9PEZI|nr:hypothetical protein NUW58_g9052 [Xylaria curta]